MILEDEAEGVFEEVPIFKLEGHNYKLKDKKTKRKWPHTAADKQGKNNLAAVTSIVTMNDLLYVA